MMAGDAGKRPARSISVSQYITFIIAFHKDFTSAAINCLLFHFDF
jgi:hypothetical protein